MTSTFPVEHYSASSMIKLSTNPQMFKILYINRDRFETVMSISGVIGQAFHHAMEVYNGGSDTIIIGDEQEAIKYGMEAGIDFLDRYNDGFINFTDAIPNKQKAFELFTYAFQCYIKEMPYVPGSVLSIEEQIVAAIDVMWRGKQIKLPVKLKGFIDKTMREDGKLKIKDYKTSMKFSDPDKIDGKKIIQAVVYYFLAYSHTGEEPYSCTFEEIKMSKNKDGGSQVRQYEIVYADNELYFDFFFRFYHDMTRALNGEMVYLPNLDTLYDNEISIISYIHRLDEPENVAKLMQKHKVDNITDLLKKQLQSSANMRKLMKSVEKSMSEAKNIDYSKMKNEEKIKTKLMEHGILVDFDSIVPGHTVDLYRYTPSIGVKMSRIRAFAQDVEQVMGVSDIRVLAPIPNSTMIGFEVPKANRIFPKNTRKSSNLIIGVDTMGNDIELVVEEMPHLLVAGSAGSGKSVFLNGVVSQLSGNYNVTVLDPKGVDFNDSITDHGEIAEALLGLLEKMTTRYEQMKSTGVKKWSQTGEKSDIVIIDEYNDLFMSSQKIGVGTDNEERVGSVVADSVKKLAQKARAAGIHLVVATQRPSVKVIDGDIKANFPTRICFRLPGSTDSKVVLDVEGAEKLKGKGDGLLLRDGSITRFQGFSNE